MLYCWFVLVLILTLCVISDIDCPHTIWTKHWEIHIDPRISPFPKDLVANYLIPLVNANCIPFDDDTLEALEYITYLSCFNSSEAYLTVSNPYIEISIICCSWLSWHHHIYVPHWFSVASHPSSSRHSYLGLLSCKHIIIVCGVLDCQFRGIS